MKNILVFGGAGYIGSHTAQRLIESGYNPIVADNLVYGHKEAVPKSVPFELVDLANFNQLKDLFKKYKFDSVIHFAAFAAVGESVIEPAKYYRNNVIGTLNLLEAMLDADVRNIVFSSTCATYGEPKYTPIDEKHPQDPINPYGQSKLMIEKIFQDYKNAYDLQWIALRYFNAAGAGENIGESHDPELHLIPLLFRAIKTGNPVNIFGKDYDTPDGTCIRDYIHVNDLAAAHTLALERLGSFSGAINLGTGVGSSINEIIRLAEQVSGKICPRNYMDRRPGDPACLFASNEIAKIILEWIPKYGINEIIKSAWEWEQNRKF